MKKLTARFTAIDTNGNKHVISQYNNVTTQNYLIGKSEVVVGIPEFRCDSGYVNMIDDNTFEIVATQTQVKKVA